MKHWLALLALVLPVVSVAADAAPAGTLGSEQLYYAVERQFPETRWEARTSFMYDFSNPYLHVLGGHLSMYWKASRFFSFGVEGGAYTTQKRDSAAAIETDLARHGIRLRAFAPEYGFTGIVRMTPISGLVNLFSSNVVQADVSISLRGGVTRYHSIGFGPSMGTGIEVNLQSPSGWGVLAATVFDWDRIDGVWQSRVGLRIGPTFRF